ncbi:MAG TPA: acyl-CoA dehydrogenase family protein [Stackebrandtia sp.]|jgi:alkylation response protein AidB-like acyl-CoA dehydrogenase|uniref:acyl-CoA dehydrogenase family protein n=1 Tax=Stackebrandtia sp. TaxID=2023065 RepID=UPI002D51D597|nr:acyl-CoA dehydrogenase family protein [Stackebrandtia sp.]HZE39141.1 acyl-CoA dehydrogenase family protein [Stackebrandtia sp.]
MTTTPGHAPPLPSLMTGLFDGRVRWDLLRDFPRQSQSDARQGDAVIAELDGILKRYGDPDDVETDGNLPDGLLETLAERGLLNMRPGPEEGGRGLSRANTFRVLEAAADWSPTLSLTMAPSNMLGAGSYLPILPPGPLREFIAANIPRGIGAGADTELFGAANRLRATTATPVDDGAAYLVNGEKAYIVNSPGARIIDVSATILDNGDPRVALFFLTTDTPGVEVGPRHDFIGYRGLPNGMIRLRDVRVPREHVLGDAADGWRSVPELTGTMNQARMFIIGSSSLSITKHCVRWATRFAARKHIDGVPLAEYDHARQLLASGAADAFALESLIAWCIHGAERADTMLEQRAAKNLTSMTCWRVTDQTVSLMGAEGTESAASKKRRNAPHAEPVERFQRNARVLRVSGGVDFLVDYAAGRAGVFAHHYAMAAGEVSRRDGVAPPTPEFVGPNRDHADAIARLAREYASRAEKFVRRHPDPADLHRHEQIPITMNQIGSELTTMAIALARGHQSGGVAADLADVYCVHARRRVDDLWCRLDASTPQGQDRVVADLLDRHAPSRSPK